MEQLIIKIIDKYCPNDKDIRNLLQYIIGKGSNKNKERVQFISARGLSFNHEKAASQLIAIQRILKKDVGRRVYHMVVSFPKDFDDYKVVVLIAHSIAAMLFQDYHTFYGIHTSTDNLHIHFAFNAVSYRTGKKWHNTIKELIDFKEQILNIVNNTLIKYGYASMKLKKF